MFIPKIAIFALAAIVAVGGVAGLSAAVFGGEDASRAAAENIELRKDDNAGEVATVADEDEADDPPTGDGDRTRGDDGTDGGNNTGDGDATRGDDGTDGGHDTAAPVQAAAASAPAASAPARAVAAPRGGDDTDDSATGRGGTTG